jgi:hypothetical protein
MKENLFSALFAEKKLSDMITERGDGDTLIPVNSS